MGYYTTYRLTVLNENNEKVDVSEVDAFKEKELCGGYCLSVENLVDDPDSMQWYDHDGDMIAYSKKYPNFTFVLDGDGEKPGDNWRSFYRNGYIYEWKLKFERPDFDASQLVAAE